MKETKNNDIDALLRFFARRERIESRGHARSAATGDISISDHLDADELNSYAEGVVPAFARARYTEHLADCERCRGIVVGLTQSTGLTARHEVRDQQRVGFWQTFAALFAPPVLRYGVPALVLTAIIAAGLLALRQPQRTEFVAQNEPQKAPAALSLSNPTPSQSNDAAQPIQQGNVQTATSSDSKLAKQNAQSERNTSVQASASPLHDQGEESATKNFLQPGQASGVAKSQTPLAPQPPPSPAKPAPSEGDKIEAVERVKVREAQERTRTEDRDRAVNEPGADRGSVFSKPAAAPRTTGKLGGFSVAGRGGLAKEKKDSNDEVETRVVSGRTFRRQGSAWIDTAYEASRATTSVARGSEQYRSLVADEPGIRAIAEQLGGEVIVVWKGRAYRLH
jgi:hypothetical protein